MSCAPTPFPNFSLHPRRQAILAYLTHGSQPVRDIARALGVPVTCARHHVLALKREGILIEQPRNQFRVPVLQPGGLT